MGSRVEHWVLRITVLDKGFALAYFYNQNILRSPNKVFPYVENERQTQPSSLNYFLIGHL